MLFFRNFISKLFSVKMHLLVLLLLETVWPILNSQFLQGCCSAPDKISFKNSFLTCNYDIFSNKLCFFNSIFFIKDEESAGSLIFMANENASILGLRDQNSFKTINLSSVRNHSKMFLNVVVVNDSQTLTYILIKFLARKDPQIFQRFRFMHNVSDSNSKLTVKLPSKIIKELFDSNAVVISTDPIFMLRRFKCDNIMHVIHDDLLPLFITYYHLCKGDIDLCISTYRLFFHDDCTSSEFLELYKIFSIHEPLVLYETKHSDSVFMISSDRIYLFTNLRVGVDTSTVWYDYGFTNQQGKIDKSNVDIFILKKFCNFLLRKLRIKKKSSQLDKINVLFLNRKLNRKIINASKLKEEIKRTSSMIFQKDIVISESDLYNNSITNLIEKIVDADIIVGMHSAAMILTIFRLLKGKTVIFELFPFGIQPEYVSFLYSLKEIFKQKITYKFWVNHNESNSIIHPNYAKMYGGLQHLTVHDQKNILDTKIIPPVKCCHNPAYLFRMYQDTLVDESFFKLFHSSIKNFEFSHEGKNEENNWFFPARVSCIRCLFSDSKVGITWNVPENTLFKAVKYKIVISTGKVEQLAFIVTENQLVLDLKYYNIHQRPLKLSIWVKSFLSDQIEAESSDVYSSCTEGELDSASDMSSI